MMLKKICILSNYDAIRMFWLFVCAWLVEQVLSIGIEHLVWGDGFVHWFDVAFTACLFGFYALCANYLADSITVMVNGKAFGKREECLRYIDSVVVMSDSAPPEKKEKPHG